MGHLDQQLRRRPGTTLVPAAAASKARFSAPITAPSCWRAITLLSRSATSTPAAKTACCRPTVTLPSLLRLDKISSASAAWATSTTLTCRFIPFTSTTLTTGARAQPSLATTTRSCWPIASFTPACNGNFGGACVPQKGITDKVDSLGDRLMYRFAYWEDQPAANVKATPPLPAPAQHWLVDFDVTASGGQMGVRWMEIVAPIRTVTPSSLQRIPAGHLRSGWRVALDGFHRSRQGGRHSRRLQQVLRRHLPWRHGHLSVHLPSRTAGQRSSRHSATSSPKSPWLTAPDRSPGTGNRWGDYSSMRIDTNDGMNGCTFWYTTEYYMVTAQFDWSTRIGSAKFSNCN